MVKKKKLLILIVAIITLINVFSVAVLYFNLLGIEAPETTIEIEVISISPNEAIIQSTLDIYNPNSFDLIVKNLELITSTPDGEKIAQMNIEGGSIPPKKSKIFTESFQLDFKGKSPEILESKLKGSMGIKSGFIEKTLPLSVNIITKLDKVITNLAVPIINIDVDFGEITQDNVNLTFQINAYNPNDFDILIEDILMTITSEKGENVGNVELEEGKLAAKGSLDINGNGTILIKALNAEKINVNVSAQIGAKIAGFTKVLPFFVETSIGVPSLKDIIPSKMPVDARLRGDFKVTLRGVTGQISLEFINPHGIEFFAKDITFKMNRIDGDKIEPYSECSLGEGVIKAEDTTVFKGELLIPYRKILIPPNGERIIPEWIELIVRANITINGLNDYIWIGVIALQDLHFFRTENSYTSATSIEWE